MMASAVRAAVILLNYRGARDTLACLDSLLRSEQGFQRLYIADNGSGDGSLETLRTGLAGREPQIRLARERWQSAPLQTLRDWGEYETQGPRKEACWITLVDNAGNLGFAAGNNTALQLALGQADVTHFWLLNNDTEVLPDTLGALAHAAAARPEIDLWGATVVYHDDVNVVQALGGGALNRSTGHTRHVGAFEDARKLQTDPQLAQEAEAQLDYALGASMFASRRWVEEVGLLNTDFFLYYEELDWATRGRQRGLKLGYAPAALVRHKEGASIGTAPSGGSLLSIFHLARSRCIYMRRFLPSTLPRVVASMAWQAVKFLLKGHPSKSSALLRGAWSGMRHARATRASGAT